MSSGHTALTHNGVPQKDRVKRMPQFVEYVPQSDKHFATLTTHETLEYADKFVGAGRRRAPTRPGAQFGHTANLQRPYSQQSPSGHTASSRPVAIQPRDTIRPYSQAATAIQTAVA
ncbi:hypothetical protein PF005_g14252 [Phytophthora fragariae]|uniref:Uncharacterized protein n=1 Tax=Phytophthora fragariae TaxID=53985 RepID=A0A6A3XIP6_9STRA|nr:hypothetical protein PF003_g3934 [Phytophthora fragariae]KAE8934597.1 hypothetical protein PF009_g15427 [Phytophthora fragariae]KAE9018853.1 hypothetical protein PF011_g6083 [Phytophthora fragariae]KAE9102909.1 hypothetical protein PF010_g13944 [Phytophthora fragariae]KAE9103077.1 hypothetical protein PF007_g14528 [Phytophthora fragariae]